MYNLFKLQKHDAFYKSREGGKCSIKCFNVDCGMPCYTTKADEKISHSCPLTDGRMDGWTDTQGDSKSELCSSLKMLLPVPFLKKVLFQSIP